MDLADLERNLQTGVAALEAAEARELAARYSVERVYFTLYCQRVAAGQMDAADIAERMTKALAEYDKLLRRAEDEPGVAGNIKREVDKTRDYEAECVKALGRAP